MGYLQDERKDDRCGLCADIIDAMRMRQRPWVSVQMACKASGDDSSNLRASINTCAAYTFCERARVRPLVPFSESLISHVLRAAGDILHADVRTEVGDANGRRQTD